MIIITFMEGIWFIAGPHIPNKLISECRYQFINYTWREVRQSSSPVINHPFMKVSFGWNHFREALIPLVDYCGCETVLHYTFYTKSCCDYWYSVLSVFPVCASHAQTRWCLFTSVNGSYATDRSIKQTSWTLPRRRQNSRGAVAQFVMCGVKPMDNCCGHLAWASWQCQLFHTH